MSDTKPTAEELDLHNLRAFKGIEVGLGEADPVAAIAQKLEAQHPGHLILVQSGNFLHGFDRTAYALSILKSYKLKLIGATSEPHLRVGFPLGNFKRRLWTVVEEFGIPYVVALGTLASGRTIYTSAQPTGNTQVLESISPNVITEVIDDLKQRGEVNKAAAQQLLTNPDNTSFQLKTKAKELDLQLLQDIIKMPRDLRTHGRLTLGREFPDAQASKARQHAQPETAALPTGGAVGCGKECACEQKAYDDHTCYEDYLIQKAKLQSTCTRGSK